MLRELYFKFCSLHGQFSKEAHFESECEDPKDDTSDALVVLKSKRPNPGFGLEGVNDIASSLAESPFQPNLMLYPNAHLAQENAHSRRTGIEIETGWSIPKRRTPLFVTAVGLFQNVAAVINRQK